jgi:ABC-type uncharacterized transport system substrate-binding protein
MPVIGFLSGASPGPQAANIAAFQQALSETGYAEGKTVAIEYRWAEGVFDRLPALARDLVAQKIDLIAALSPPAALAAKAATSTIPIVFQIGADPVALGLVASLARPGGNITGVSILLTELVPKRLELITEMVPGAKTIALLVNPNGPEAEPATRIAEAAARQKGLLLPILKARHRARDRRRLHGPGRTACRRASCWQRSVLFPQTQATRGPGRPARCSDDPFSSRVRRGRRPVQLWTEHYRHLPPGGPVCRQDPERRKAGRYPGTAADEIRAGDQHANGQGAGSEGAEIGARPRRRAHRMRRRELIIGLGCSGSTAILPLAVHAQQQPVIGFIRSTTAAPFGHLVKAFQDGLNAEGFVEGKNVSIQYRYADNQRERLPALANELVQSGVAVIIGNSLAAEAAKQATTTIPIVFITADDPVKRGLVSSLARPGGNATGFTFFGGGKLAAKRIEILHELIPLIFCTNSSQPAK